MFREIKVRRVGVYRGSEVELIYGKISDRGRSQGSIACGTKGTNTSSQSYRSIGPFAEPKINLQNISFDVKLIFKLPSEFTMKRVETRS